MLYHADMKISLTVTADQRAMLQQLIERNLEECESKLELAELTPRQTDGFRRNIRERIAKLEALDLAVRGVR